MLDPVEITRMIERFERLCDELRTIRRLIDQDPSPEDLRLAVQLTIDTMLQDMEMQDLEIQNLQDRMSKIEAQAKLAGEPPASEDGAP